MFGTDKSFNFFGEIIKYYLDSGIGYRIINDSNYDEFKFNIISGIRFNQSSTFVFEYERQYFLQSDILSSNANTYNDYYENNNSNKFQISLNYKFLDNLSTKLAFYRNFSETNSNGIIFSFIFNQNLF